MAHVKNTGNQPPGFYDEGMNHVIIAPGMEGDIAMTEEYYKKLEQQLDNEKEMEHPVPFELSGGAGGQTKPAKVIDDPKQKEKKEKDDEKEKVDRSRDDKK